MLNANRLIRSSIAMPMVLFSLASMPAVAAPHSFNFATPVQTAVTQAPGKWYVDRFAPCGFVSPQTAPDNTIYSLKESICAADHQTPTPSFYNTQGRKFDLPAGTLSVTIALYVPASWATENARKAGFWATAFDSGDPSGMPPTPPAATDFPIIEFQGPITSDAGGPSPQINGGVAGFYGWNNVTATYQLIGLPTGFVYNSWVQLTMTLIPGVGFRYEVGDKSLSSPFNDPENATLDNVILQGYNYNRSYDIFWNSAVPQPTLLTRYASNLTQGDSIVNITNTGANGASLYGPGYGTAVGNLCVNVYAFSPDEQLISCCSCLVTPNGLVNVTANRDLVSNTLTGISPNSIVVKLIATAAGPDFTASTCTNSAALAGQSAFPLAHGMHAWGTTLHSAVSVDPPPAGTVFSITETPFLAGTLSEDELASVRSRCANILGNGSTFGQCRSCRQGGLGGAKL